VPGAVTLLPPLLTVVLAIVTGDVLVSLFVGMWGGALIVCQYNPGKLRKPSPTGGMGWPLPVLCVACMHVGAQACHLTLLAPACSL
jgi:hypothetical protein